MFNKLIDEAFEKKLLFGFRTKFIDWGEIILGYIDKVTDLYIIVNEVDKYGYSIGYTVVDRNDILHVEMNDKYQETINTLNKSNKTFNRNTRYTVWLPLPELLKYFELIKEQEKIATFYLNEDDYVIGKIRDIDSTCLLIENITENGEIDGISCYSNDSFIGVRYDSIDEQKIEFLFRRCNPLYMSDRL